MTTATHDAGLGVELALDRASAAVVAYRAHVRKVIEVEVAPLVDAAERGPQVPPAGGRRARRGRVGGGTDEMMLELVASGLRTDDALYEKWISE